MSASLFGNSRNEDLDKVMAGGGKGLREAETGKHQSLMISIYLRKDDSNLMITIYANKITIILHTVYSFAFPFRVDQALHGTESIKRRRWSDIGSYQIVCAHKIHNYYFLGQNIPAKNKCQLPLWSCTGHHIYFPFVLAYGCFLIAAAETGGGCSRRLENLSRRHAGGGGFSPKTVIYHKKIST